MASPEACWQPELGKNLPVLYNLFEKKKQRKVEKQKRIQKKYILIKMIICRNLSPATPSRPRKSKSTKPPCSFIIRKWRMPPSTLYQMKMIPIYRRVTQEGGCLCLGLDLGLGLESRLRLRMGFKFFNYNPQIKQIKPNHQAKGGGKGSKEHT